MCNGRNRGLPSKPDIIPSVSLDPEATAALFILRNRLIVTEARLARARDREAELTRRLHHMKRFVSVMEILESYLNRRFRQQQHQFHFNNAAVFVLLRDC